MMTDKNAFLEAASPLLHHLQQTPRPFVATDVEAVRASLVQAFPVQGPVWQALRHTLRAGIEAGTLCTRENAGVRFERVLKPTTELPWSIDIVHMKGAGPGHVHPNGEVDVCFAVDAGATFDGHAEGYVVYPPGSHHVPTVFGGRMDIVYFLPGGAITFDG